MGPASSSGALGLYYFAATDEKEDIIVRKGMSGCFQVCVRDETSKNRRYQIVAEVTEEHMAYKLKVALVNDPDWSPKAPT